MYDYEEQFRKDRPETIGEKDKHFDLENYKDWLELKLENAVDLLRRVMDLQKENQTELDKQIEIFLTK